MVNASSSVLVRIEERLLLAWGKTLDLLGWVLWNVAVGLFLLGCTVLLFQAARWLRHGVWMPIFFTDVLPASFPLSIAQPNDGVWKVGTFVLSCSVWWVLIVLAVPVFSSSLVAYYFAARAMPEHPSDSTGKGADVET